jgi:molybdopterin/thiamine biosynthesis adenylyltransferase
MSTPHVSIVGGGLLGSMFVPALTAHVTSLDVELFVSVVDYDQVEKRNSPGNLGIPTNIGRLKTEVLSDMLKSAEVQHREVKQRVTDKNAHMALGKSDIVVGAVDNIETRKLIHRACVDLGIPYMDMGLSDLVGNVSWTIADKVDTMPYIDNGLNHEMPVVDKQPACTLVSTRIISAIVTECAAKSLFLFISGHDPFSLVNELVHRKGTNYDAIGWNVISAKGQIIAIPTFLGNFKE